MACAIATILPGVNNNLHDPKRVLAIWVLHILALEGAFESCETAMARGHLTCDWPPLLGFDGEAPELNPLADSWMLIEEEGHVPIPNHHLPLASAQLTCLRTGEHALVAALHVAVDGFVALALRTSPLLLGTARARLFRSFRARAIALGTDLLPITAWALLGRNRNPLRAFVLAATATRGVLRIEAVTTNHVLQRICGRIRAWNHFWSKSSLLFDVIPRHLCFLRHCLCSSIRVIILRICLCLLRLRLLLLSLSAYAGLLRWIADGKASAL
mmetsp:Transcript_983/g.2746  ORF Transcript_983/g.2746 Transcript_983/m.2746 type:complete len:271 (+) Transcript_983:1957-2769(+)